MEFRSNIIKSLLWILLWMNPLQSFAQTGPEKVQMLLHSLESESDYKVRIAAAQALSQIADGSIADWMVRAFRKENNEAVRLAILFSISEIPDERILSPLIELDHEEILSQRERTLIEQIIIECI